MKKILLYLLSLWVSGTAIAQTTKEKMSVKVKAGSFTINTAAVTPTWRLFPVSSVITGTDRKKPGYNTTHTYDDLGMVLFERNNEDQRPSGQISEVQLYFGQIDSGKVAPSGVFTGKIQVENLVIKTAITPKEVQDKLKDYKLTDSYMKHNYRLAYKGIYIYFVFNDDETRLMKMSIGPAKRDDDPK